MIKRLVCLANSRKLHGRCIAGRELLAGNPGEGIRPVSDREDEEVSEYERQYEDGSDPRVLVTQGTRVLHIHADGQLETHRDAERRLLRLMGLHELDLFRTEAQILTDAYERQEARIAYVMPHTPAEDKAVR